MLTRNFEKLGLLLLMAVLAVAVFGLGMMLVFLFSLAR
jgi:hypothetical protein